MIKLQKEKIDINFLTSLLLEAEKSNKLVIENENKAIDIFIEQLSNYLEDFETMMNETQVKNLGILTQLTISAFKSGIIVNSLLQSQGLEKFSNIAEENKELKDIIIKYQKYFDDTPNYIQ